MAFIEADREKPFFAYIPTNAPHGPFNVAEKYSKLYVGNPAVPNAAFYGMITNIDENMGRLIEKLDAQGIADDTILIFMTDNGTAAGFRGGKGFNAGMRGTKGSLYEGGHRVPCFIRWPGGGLSGGRDIDALTAHIDLAPTLIELCGLKRPQGIDFDGVSIAPLLLDKCKELPNREIFVQFRQSSQPPEKGNATVMTERWRLVGSKALFDIDADPGQSIDVAARHPEVVRRLLRAYDAWWTDVSRCFDEYNYIILGDDAENPARLSSFDWHTKTAWSQGQIRSGAVVNSFWAVEIVCDGRYEIALRRWPAEADAPINAAVPGGKAIVATEARLKIADVDLSKPIPADAAAVTFDVDLKAGKTTLQTWLTDKKTGQSRGAYYVYVTHLSE
jgi:hypothetical protein